MRRYGLLVPLFLVAFAAPAIAGGAYGRFLPPDQAYRLQVQVAPGEVLLTWHIAAGYYLYRDRFKIKAQSTRLGRIVLPPAKIKHDPNFGRVAVYYRQVRLVVPVAAGGSVRLRVTYQGCAESGLCYIPSTRILNLQVPPGGSGNKRTQAFRADPGGKSAW